MSSPATDERTFEEQIAEVLEMFDDYTAVNIMDEQRLEWLCARRDGGEGGEMRTPTRAEFRIHLEARLREAAESEGEFYRSAGKNYLLILKVNGCLAAYFTPVYFEWTP